MKTIADIIAGLKRHDKDAIVYKTGYRTFRLTYKQLHKKVLQTVAWLDELGIKKGDSIILWAYNSPNWTIVFLACAYRGIIVVPIDAKAVPEFVEKIHKAVHTKMLFYSAYKLPPHLTTQNFVLDYLDKYLEGRSASGVSESSVSENDLLEIVYTSGTTADPKGVMLTHKNLLANITAVKKTVNITSEQTFLSVLPLSHLFEQNPGFLAPLSIGCTIIYLQGIRPNLIFKTLKEERVTNIILVPRLLKLFADGIKREYESKGLTSMLNRFLAFEGSTEMKKILFFPVHKKFGFHFQFFISGGAPLAEELDQFWTQMGFSILQGYGLTETSPVLTVNALEKKKDGSVGFALPGVDLKIQQGGEIYAKGDNITSGYYHKEKETRALFDDGWMRTGDIGEIDEDGFLYLKGRAKDMIVTAAGLNIYPEDIEQKLLEMPEVKDACVVGLPTENGEEVHAELILKHTTDLRKLVAQVNNQLNESQQITSFAKWEKDDFPRTTTMKIQKRFVLSEIQNRQQKAHATSNTNIPKLYQLIARINAIDPSLITPNANLSLDLKLTSINRVELVSLIEQEFNVDIDEEEITTETTVADIEKMVKDRNRIEEKNIFHRVFLSMPIRIIRYIYNIIVLDTIVRIFCIRTVKGVEHLAHLDQPVIFISNHTSYFDAPNILMSMPFGIRNKIAAAAHREYFDAPKNDIGKRLLYGFYYYHGSIATNIYVFPRIKGFKKSLEYTGELLDKKWNILFFPEGKHSHDGTLLEFQTGIGWLIKEMRVPVVPIKVAGMNTVLPGDFGDKLHFPKRGKVSVTFGKQFEPDYTKSIPELTKELQELIRAL
jgi:long-chain acyl-CoA synthetase